MDRNKQKEKRRTRRCRQIRRDVSGSVERPRLSVFRSHANIYAQVIDDVAGQTLCSASTSERDFPLSYGGNVEAAKKVGELLGQRAQEKGIQKVAFDRNGFRYHGRVKALADAARESGLKF